MCDRDARVHRMGRDPAFPGFTGGILAFVTISVALHCLAPAVSANVDVVTGARQGKVYHTQPDCPALKKIAAENRVPFKSVAEAEAEGRRLCKNCEKLAAKPAPPSEQSPPPAPAESKPPRTKSTSNPAEPRPQPNAGISVRVKKVLPGGTLQLENGEKITLAGAIVPQPGQELADVAATFIQERIRGRKIAFFAATEQGDSPVRDALGRIPGRIQPDAKKPDLGGELIKNGLAWADRAGPMDAPNDYAALEDEAWQAGRGIWRRLDGESGRTQVTAGRYAIQFHPVRCPHVAHLTEPSTITLNEARARRLTPCENYRCENPSQDNPDTAFKKPGTTDNAKEKSE